MLEDLLPCYCHAIQTNIKTIHLQVWQLAALAGTGAVMSELQAYHRMTPE